MTDTEVDCLARTVPEEERPVPKSRFAGFGSFLGIYGGEHIAATEFVIGALLVTWGVKAGELVFGCADAVPAQVEVRLRGGTVK